MSLYKCGWFGIEELVSPDIVNLGDEAWELFDEKLLITLDRMRNVYGPMTINNWAHGGEITWSGLRTIECPYYNALSQHSFGRAVDIVFENFSTCEVEQDILSGPNLKEFEHITTVMYGEDYLHIDVRNGERFTVLTA